MRPSSFFMGTGRHVPVMWVLAVDCPLAVDGGGAVLVGWMVIGMWVCLPYAKGRRMTMTSSSLSSICVAGLSGRVVCPSSFFVVAGHRVLVMWVLAVNRQWAVDCGGAVLVGWVVIGVVGLLPVGGRLWWCCVSGVGGNRRGVCPTFYKRYW